MLRVIPYNAEGAYQPCDGFTADGIAKLAAESADHKLLAMDAAGKVAGHCSLWSRGTPTLNHKRTGLIGHFAAWNAAAAKQVLDSGCAWLAQSGAETAIGPMDGSTWRSYRLITRRGNRPPFFLEPDHPDSWPGFFEQAGFASLADYVSAEGHDLTIRHPKVQALQSKLTSHDITLRKIDLHRFADELARMHALSLRAFSQNFLYTPIDRDTFVSMYRPIREKLVPELVLLAERRGELLGFVFGIPDLLQARRDEVIDTMILKTLAVRPGREGAGLGSLLMERCQIEGHRLGYRRVIHALMHESNKSMSLSIRYARPFRRYTLLARELR